MSLVPYSSRDSREIVLRHNDAIVIRDPQTQQLMLRGAPSFTECPTCHRPFRSASPERQHSSPHSTPFISPEYFRMLQSANNRTDDQAHSPLSHGVLKLVQPALRGRDVSNSSMGDAEFVASTPAPQTTHGIKKDAFSPNYFEKFFIEEKELGRGGKGVVLLVRHELDSVSLGQFACKRVPVGDDHAWLERVLIEVQLLQGLSHPNLVSYRHVWLEDVVLNRFSPSVPCAFILQQYCNSGDLLHYIVGTRPNRSSTNEQLKEQMRRRSRGGSERPNMKSSKRKLSFEEIYSFFKDITSGLAHLHGSNYIHRDLKPSNCLLHRDGNEFHCLISDFGEVQAENVVRKSTGSTGTISYCAPEVLKQDESGHYGNFTTKSDIFSLGMILYFMCFGRLPYRNAESIEEDFEDMDLLRAEISTWSGFQDEQRERPELPKQLYDFLKRLLAINPAARPSANDILQALRTEKGLEKPPRSRSGSISASIGHRRFQSIDSPMPSTPVDGRRVTSTPYLEDAPSSDSESEYLPLRASPTRPKKMLLDSRPSTSTSLTLTHEKRSHSRAPNDDDAHPSPQHTPPIRTPLLMAPPTTVLSRFRHRLFLTRHYTVSWIHENDITFSLFSRLVIFFVKIFSVTRHCMPAATRETILYGLTGLAALELGLGKQIRLSAVAAFALLHIVVVLSMNLWGGGLCSTAHMARAI